MELNSEQVFGLLTKIIGEITPLGDSAFDKERLENARLFIEVFDKMHAKIDNIAHNFKDSQRHSEKVIGMLCNDHIDSMGICEGGCNSNLNKAADDLLEALIETQSDLFYQIDAKHGPETAKKYPSIIKADNAIEKATK